MSTLKEESLSVRELKKAQELLNQLFEEVKTGEGMFWDWMGNWNGPWTGKILIILLLQTFCFFYFGHSNFEFSAMRRLF